MKENNAARVLGFRLRQERMRRDWSQEGLCRGICAVSWLSKLEQGKADASPEVLSMLLERLELPPYDDDPALGAAIEAQYERVFSDERDWDAFTPLLGRPTRSCSTPCGAGTPPTSTRRGSIALTRGSGRCSFC